MGYFTEQDMPFQFALAEAFTICDAYHCSFMGNTNPNRLFLWTGTNDPLQQERRPRHLQPVRQRRLRSGRAATPGSPTASGCRRPASAGRSTRTWPTTSPTTRSPASAPSARRTSASPASNPELARDAGCRRATSTCSSRTCSTAQLPQVSWIVATAEGSEHPGPSSPAQGADYTSRVLDALTANPEVWAKTVLFVNFDENDGFFDHVPPPAAPELPAYGTRTRASACSPAPRPSTRSASTTSSCPCDVPPARAEPAAQALRPRTARADVRASRRGARAAGSTPRCSITPRSSASSRSASASWSRTSRAWRRAVCGDLTSAFNFSDPDDSEFYEELPDTIELAERAAALPGRTTPPTPALPELPVQAWGIRPSRALPYELHAHAKERDESRHGRAVVRQHRARRRRFPRLRQASTSTASRAATPWEQGTSSVASGTCSADDGAYDLWVLGPNGFHRHFTGTAADRPEDPGGPRPVGEQGGCQAAQPQRCALDLRDKGQRLRARRRQGVRARGRGRAPRLGAPSQWRLVRLHGPGRGARRVEPPLRGPGRDRTRLVQLFGFGRSRLGRAGVVERERGES